MARAARAAFIVDGGPYFRVAEAAIRRARRRIFIMGWDFDSQITLAAPGPGGASSPPTLRELLVQCLEAQPALEVFILIWDNAVFYGPSHERPPLFGEAWHDHPRIRFLYDSNHPTGASLHQKVLCVDDRVAFVGGIDFTVKRWDTPAHDDAGMRIDIDGTPYEPVHDLQMAVDGDAARRVGDFTRERWHLATGEELPALEEAAGPDPWPPRLRVDLRDVDVAVVRTVPPAGDTAAVREVEALNVDAIDAARRHIFIETQYLTARTVGDALVRALERDGGPEVVIIVTLRSDGWIEQFAMGSNRDRLLRRLMKADRQNRLRVYYPVVPGEAEQAVSIHSKLIIVDDNFVRIGSSNLNNRSMGLDTELDLAVEALHAQHRRGIARLRARLLAEHLGSRPHIVERAMRERPSLIAAIERLNTNKRGLRPFAVAPEDGEDEPIAGTAILDPDEPINLDYLLRAVTAG